MNKMMQYTSVVLIVVLAACAPQKTTNDKALDKSEVKGLQELKATDTFDIETVPDAKDALPADGFFTDRIHLKLDPTKLEKMSAFDADKGKLGKHAQLQGLIDQFEIQSLKPAFAGLDTKIYVLKFGKSVQVEELIKACQAYDFVEYAEQIPINK